MASKYTKFYDDFFRLDSNPFGETPDPRFYFQSRTHQSALQGLIRAIEQGKGFNLLTGEVGAGKTLLSRILLESIANETNTALILYPNCTESELIRSICKELDIEAESPGIAPEGGHKSDIDRLNDYLIAHAKNDRKTVLLIDETQNMPAKTLETVRLLGNLETHNQKLFHTLLFAQPEFLKRLSQDEFRQLRQRISNFINIDCLDVAETECYIKHRIECAGGANFLRFDGETCKLIQKASQGLPRNINRICDQLITAARKRGIRLVTKSLAREVLLPSTRSEWLSKLWRGEGYRLP